MDMVTIRNDIQLEVLEKRVEINANNSAVNKHAAARTNNKSQRNFGELFLSFMLIAINKPARNANRQFLLYPKSRLSSIFAARDSQV